MQRLLDAGHVTTEKKKLDHRADLQLGKNKGQEKSEKEGQCGTVIM